MVYSRRSCRQPITRREEVLDEDIERIAIERQPPEECRTRTGSNTTQAAGAADGARPRRVVREDVERTDRLARTLARVNPTTCFLYLKRIVPGESIEHIHELAKYLTESHQSPDLENLVERSGATKKP